MSITSRRHIRSKRYLPLGAPGAWQLVFNDDFDAATINTSIWKLQRGTVTPPEYSWPDPFNRDSEDAAYLETIPYTTNGSLVLTMTQQSYTSSFREYPYVSGMASTHHGFFCTYGFFEARVKVPSGAGCWPAFWMIPQDDTQWTPEIDIFEFWYDGTNAATAHPYFNFHYKDEFGNFKQYNIKQYGPTIDYSLDYHTYGVLWSPSSIQVYLDGIAGPSYTDTAYIPNTPMYIIVNLALQKGYTPSSPQKMYIDYVRAWQPG